MNRSKKLSLLLGILTVACLFTFAVVQLEEHKEKIKETGETVLEISSDEVQSLSWEYNDTALAFRKDADGIWQYEEDQAFPVSQERIGELLEVFVSLGAAFTIEDVENYGQYGLDKPVCTIAFATDTQSWQINLGDYSKMDGKRYVSIGDGNVYLVQKDPLDYFDTDLRDLIANDETPDFEQVSQIQFAGTESYRITYEEDSDASYCADDVYYVKGNGKNLPLDSAKVNAYLSSITNLNLTDYVSYNATEEELQKYGLDAPELTVTVDYTTEEKKERTFVLSVSPDSEEKAAAEEAEDDEEEPNVSAYLRVDNSPILYHISSYHYKQLASAAYEDFRHTELFWGDFADIRQIEISLEGNIYMLTSEKKKKERTWFYQEEEIETDALQSVLKTMEADEFTGEKATQKEEISLTLSLDNENFPEVQIQLYRHDGTHCLAVVDGKSVALVKRTAVVDLIEAVHAIVLN